VVKKRKVIVKIGVANICAGEGEAVAFSYFLGVFYSSARIPWGCAPGMNGGESNFSDGGRTRIKEAVLFAVNKINSRFLLTTAAGNGKMANNQRYGK